MKRTTNTGSTVKRTIVSSTGHRYTTHVGKAKFRLGIAELEGSSSVVDCLVAVGEGVVRNAYFRHAPAVNADYTSNPEAFQLVLASQFIRTLVSAADLSSHQSVEGSNVMVVFPVRDKLLRRCQWLRKAIWERQHKQGEAFRTMIVAEKRCLIDAYFDSARNLSIFVTELK